MLLALSFEPSRFFLKGKNLKSCMLLLIFIIL